jgi:protein O-mannosyl-transferase
VPPSVFGTLVLVVRTRRRHAPAKQSSARLVRLSWLGAILALTFLVFVPTLDNSFTTRDDDYYVTKNPLLVHPDFREILATPIIGSYNPLTVWSFVLNYRLSGLNPISYRWLTLVIHVANTALVFLFIWGLSGGRLWTTVVTSLFFGIHPMHVESVAWMAERKDVLFSFFYLLGLISYLRYLERKGVAWLGLTMLWFVLSAASKPAAVVFPVTLLAIDYFRRRSLRLSTVLEKLPFFAVSIAVGVLALQAQQSAGATGYNSLWSPIQRVLFASYGILMYVVKLFAPVGLSAIYPYPSAKTGGPGTEFYVAFATLAILLPTVVYLCRRNRVILFGLAFFFINIILVVQLFAFGQGIMADRFTYLPYIGLLFALAWWLDDRSTAAPRSVPIRPLLAGCFLLLLPVSLYQSWRRCDVWQNDETLWRDALKKQPGAAVAWNGLGRVEASRGNWATARSCFLRAIELDPAYAAQAWNDLGAIELSGGNWVNALANFSRAIELDPRYWDAYANRALVHMKIREYEKSIADSRRAIELQPGNPDNHREYASIGEAHQRLGHNDSAFVYYTRAIEHRPYYAEALNNRGGIRISSGDLSGAVSDFSRAIDANPRYREAYTNRAIAYSLLHQYERSINDRRRAIELDPGNPKNYVQRFSIGEALGRMNRYREAIAEYSEAIRTAPANGSSLGTYYLRRSSAWRALGDRRRALEDAEQARRLGSKVEAAYWQALRE